MLTIFDIQEVEPAAAPAPKKLTHALKAEVVRRLACFESPSAIAKAMKEDLDIETTRQSVAFYDPTRYARRPCPKRWSDLFWRTRAEFIASKPDVGAAHGVVRVGWLDQMARAQMEKDNTAEARALLKQAADEMSRMTGHKEDGNGTADSKQSEAELKADIDAEAAKLGLALVPREDQAEAGDDEATEAPQPPGDAVSG